MPKISLNHSDAIELAELLTFLADWLSGTRTHTLADSLTTFVGHSAYSLAQLRIWRATPGLDRHRRLNAATGRTCVRVTDARSSASHHPGRRLDALP